MIKKNIRQMVIGLFFALIIGLLAWPVVTEYIIRKNIKTTIVQWNRQMEVSDAQGIRSQRNLAGWYNLNISREQPEEGFEEAYSSILNYDNHVMGLLEIPSLGTTLPIYHGVSDRILENGVGHLPETAFPIGGEGNHPVLVGQMELPGKRLFSDVSEVKTGELFYIQAPGEVLVYQVEAVQSVRPEEVNGLGPVNGEDLCTVAMISPRGAASKCLLIQGWRTYEKLPTAEDPVVIRQADRVSAGVLAALLAGMVPLMAAMLWKWGKPLRKPAGIGKNVGK